MGQSTYEALLEIEEEDQDDEEDERRADSNGILHGRHC